MEGELTLGAIYDSIADKLAEARTRAMMGERQQALGILHGAALEMTRFRDALRDVPGYLALDYAFDRTMTALCAEQEVAAFALSSDSETEIVEIAAEKPRRRLKKAA